MPSDDNYASFESFHAFSIFNLPFKRYVFFFFFFFFWNSSTEEQMRFLRTALHVLTSLGAMLDILD